MSIVTIQRFGSLFLMLWAVLCMGIGMAASPAVQNDWPDLSGNWIMVQQLVATANLPVVGSITIDTTVGVLTYVSQSGSQLILQDRYCFTDARPSSFLFTTNIEDVTMQSIRPAPRVAALTQDDCDVQFTQPWYTEVRGAVLENTLADPLPTAPEDSRLVDLEADGKPGMTIRASILGLFSGEGYAVQRYQYSLSGTVFDADTILGQIDWLSEQTVVSATNPLFMETFTDATHPDPTKHRFVMVRVDEECTCDTVRERLPQILEVMAP